MIIKNSITEASQTKQAFERLEKKLKEELQLSDSEITYAIEFYKEVKKLELFESSYFENFKYEGEIFDLNNIQKFAKYPEAFHDIVMIVLHNPAFLDFYRVEFDGINVKIEKIGLEEREKEVQRSSATPFDDYKVAEDANYYTFYVPNHNIGKEIRYFFGKVYPNDERITGASKYYPTWCIISSSGSEHFNSEKIKDTDFWLVTYSKKNPADLEEEEFSKYSTFKELADARFGEVFLIDENNSIDRKGKTSRGNKDNYGYHNFQNDPHYGLKSTKLSPSTAYSYFDIDLDNPIFFRDFTIEAGVLVKSYVNNRVVRIPQGVTEIAEGAFENLPVEEVILAPSTRIIRSGAFKNTRELYAIRATNNLEVVESGAFSDSMSRAYEGLIDATRFKDAFEEETKEFLSQSIKDGKLFVFGVIESDDNGLTISKPSRLRYMPKDMSRAIKFVQERLSEGRQEENTRRKRKKSLKESFRVKRDTYEQNDLYSIERDRLIVDALPEYAKDVTDLDLSDVSGVSRVVLNLNRTSFPNLKTITFPEGVTDISNVNLSGARKIRSVDLSKTDITEIPENAFSKMSRLRTVKLPGTIEEIKAKAFASSGIEELTIDSAAVVHPTAFNNTPFLKKLKVYDVEAFKEKQSEQTLKKLASQKIKIERS